MAFRDLEEAQRILQTKLSELLAKVLGFLSIVNPDTGAVTATSVTASSITVGGSPVLDTSVFSTNAETIAGSSSTKSVTPASLAALTATTGRRGLIRAATSAETLAAALSDVAVSPLSLRAYTEQGWERVVPTGISSSGATATFNTATGVVTLPPGCTQINIDGLFAAGYEYELAIDVATIPGHSTDERAYMRMREGGVVNATTSYNTAGMWAQYNGVSGIYNISGGSAGAIGSPSGTTIYTDFSTVIRLRPSTMAKMYFYQFESFTGGSARGVKAGGYTAGATTQFDGIFLMFNTNGTAPTQGKIRVFKRKLA